MDVVCTTLCYPEPEAPNRGIFVERRLRAIHALTPVTVVAPQPWFPILRPARAQCVQSRVSACDEDSCGGGQARGSVNRPGTRHRTIVAEADAIYRVTNGLPLTLPVVRPRMFYLPALFKRYDAWWFARALERGLHEAASGDEGGCRAPQRFDSDSPHRPRLIDTHFEWPDGVGAWHVARRVGAAFVCTLRGKLGSQSRDPAKRRQIAAMLRDADGLIAVSRSLAEQAREVAQRDLVVRVIPNGVQRTVFFAQGDQPALRDALGWVQGARYVVSVGHMQASKGFHRLVAAWPDVQRRVGGDVRLVLVGGEAGERGYARRLGGMIESMGLRDAVSLVGSQPPVRIAAMLNAADLFALATETEGCCNAMIEALACGCPVVATDVGGNGELVRAEWMGRLGAMETAQNVAEMIAGALTQSWDRAAIAASGGARDWSVVAAECVDVWEEVMARTGRAALRRW